MTNITRSGKRRERTQFLARVICANEPNFDGSMGAAESARSFRTQPSRVLFRANEPNPDRLNSRERTQFESDYEGHTNGYREFGHSLAEGGPESRERTQFLARVTCANEPNSDHMSSRERAQFFKQQVAVSPSTRRTGTAISSTLGKDFRRRNPRNYNRGGVAGEMRPSPGIRPSLRRLVKSRKENAGEETENDLHRRIDDESVWSPASGLRHFR